MEHRLDIDPLLRKYCEDWSTSESQELKDVERYTHLNTVKRHDASDTIQGRLISFISHLIRPKLVVEIGTFTAYATGCLAEGLAPNGRIISIEEETYFQPLIERNLKIMKLEEKVEMIFGDALKVLPTVKEKVDLLFIDAAKYEYNDYFDLTIDKMDSGGVNSCR